MGFILGSINLIVDLKLDCMEMYNKYIRDIIISFLI
jgi:hypothetical protein